MTLRDLLNDIVEAQGLWVVRHYDDDWHECNETLDEMKCDSPYMDAEIKYMYPETDYDRSRFVGKIVVEIEEV